MKKFAKFGVVTLAAMFGLCLCVNAGSAVWKAEDTESPILIKYNGTGSPTATVDSTTAKLTLSDGLDVFIHPYQFGTTNTVAGLIGRINSATNASARGGKADWTALQWGSLSTDTLSTKVVAVSATALTPGVWSKIMKWDSSGAGAYDCVPDFVTANGPLGNFEVTQIFGEPLPVGDLTLSVYSDDTLVWRDKVLADNLLTGSSAASNWNSSAVSVSIGAGQRCLIRASGGCLTGGGMGGYVQRN